MMQFSVGVVGAGTIATQMHLPVLSCMPNVRLAWIADENEVRGRMAAAAFGVPFAPSMAPDSLPACDVALLAIPIMPRHAFLDVFSSRGTAVLSEKPFALTSPQHAKMMALFPPHRIGCGYMRRMYSSARLLQRAVSEHWFGPLRRIRMAEGARGTRTGVDASYQDLPVDEGGGVLTNLGCHSLDLALFVSGASSFTVDRSNVEWDDRTDRKVMATLILEGPAEQCPLDLTLSWLDYQPNEIELEFDDVTLVSSLAVGGDVRVRRNGQSAEGAAFQPLPGWATTSNQAFFLEWDTFLTGLRSGFETEISANRSLAVARAIDSLLRPESK